MKKKKPMNPMKHMKRMSQMHHMKRLAALFLAAVILILPARAFATAPTNSSVTDKNKGSITIDNPKDGVTYTAYKIFDVSYTVGGTSYSYSIKTNDGWYDYVKTYADTAGNGLTLTPSAVGGVDAVTTGTGFSAAKFAKYLSEYTAATGGVELTKSGTGENAVAKAENLPLGYYFVKGANDALCNLTTTDPAVTIHDKNDVPFTKTVDDGDGNAATVPENDGVTVGQTLTYTITGRVPDTEGTDTYYYRAKDTMSDGLTFDATSLRVRIDGVNVSMMEVTDADATLTGNQVRYNANGFELSLNVKGETFNVPIEITYNATVNEDAVTVISDNEAVLSYGHDPDDLEESTPQEVEVFSAKLVIDKYKKNAANEDDKSTKLSGAKFVLKDGDGNYYKGTFTTEADGTLTLTRVEWLYASMSADATVVTTDANGSASFDGLKNGTYYLVETEAPAGYNLLKDPVEVEINASIGEVGGVKALINGTKIVEVANSDGTELPTTGGIGTTIFYVLGGVLMLGAVVLLVSRKRMDKKGKK